MAMTADSRAFASSDELMTTITEAVVTASGADPMALLPLERTIDPEAITTLVDDDGLRDLTFSYHNHIVTVAGNGHVRVSSWDE